MIILLFLKILISHIYYIKLLYDLIEILTFCWKLN
uniref:Uncharacterized protein n=1 Tax=Polysiphonia scopulorum TaxID=257860 RepID=A0A1Z1MHH2_9FLOR|nr:hypothetical protein [Polysiphonia scopulorum]ARW65530.1 hypothetical protein [Polysiphonia scopulorum]